MKTHLIVTLVLLAGCAAPDPNARPVYAPIVIPPATFTPMQTSRPVQPAGLSGPAPNAFWTGRQELTQTITGQQAWRCEYNLNGRLFARLFQGGCPPSIAVQ